MQTPTRLSRFIFATRWLQAPLYIGLIFVLLVYVYEFGIGLIYLVTGANGLDENKTMIQALNLIDVVMIANLLIMVIIGGYQTFVSDLKLNDHPDHPEWLDEVNAGSMKVKLALALIGISSIHLLRTFIEASDKMDYSILWQIAIHLTLIISAIAIAYTNRILEKSHKAPGHDFHKGPVKEDSSS